MKRTSAIYRAISFSLLAAAATTLAAAPAPAQPDTSAASSTFDGIYAWGRDANKCTFVDSATERTYTCTGLSRNFIGNAALIRFPDKNYTAVVKLADGSHPGSRLDWTEQNTWKTPLVGSFGVLKPGESKTLNGNSGPWTKTPDWDLGLDAAPGRSGAPRTVDVSVTITRRPQTPTPPEPPTGSLDLSSSSTS